MKIGKLIILLEDGVFKIVGASDLDFVWALFVEKKEAEKYLAISKERANKLGYNY